MVALTLDLTAACVTPVQAETFLQEMSHQMKKSPILLVLTAIFFVAGCSTPSKQPNRDVSTSCSEEGIFGKIPQRSLFAKVKLDMPMNQVYDLIGLPTDEQTYPSSKSFIPFYRGNDGVRTDAYYKGLGKIVFSGANIHLMQVLRVEYDPSETGHSR